MKLFHPFLKVNLSVFIFFFLAFIQNLTFPHQAYGKNPVGHFASLNLEGLWMSSASTFSGLVDSKLGTTLLIHPQIESYFQIRAGADTRTLLARDGVFRDNFLFTGVGFDYVELIPKFRLFTQLGYSIALFPEVPKAGWDARVGVTYLKQIDLLDPRAIFEIYSEAIYYHRYLNFLPILQARGFYKMIYNDITTNSFAIGPWAVFQLGFDTNNSPDARYFEGRLGLKTSIALSKNGFWNTFDIIPYVDRKWFLSTVSAGKIFQDFQLLMTFGGNF